MKKLAKNKILLLIGSLLIIGGAVGGFFIWKESKVEPTIVFNNDIKFEYGESLDLDVLNFIDKDASLYDEISFESLSCGEATQKEISTESVGEFEIPVFATYRKNCKSFDLKYTVIDTVDPQLTNIKDIKITEGDKVDFTAFKANDPIDGELEVTIEGEYDLAKAGTYTLKASAKDANGNTSEEEFKLIVEAKPEDVVVAKPEESKPTTNTSKPTTSTKPSQNTNSGSSNPSGSTESKPNETKPKEEPTSCKYVVGNSGKLFDTEQEAIDWAENYATENFREISGYLWWSTCDKTTIDLSYYD